MTNFEKLKSDKYEMAYYMDCPYGAADCLPQCEEKSCMECCVDWLDLEAKEKEMLEEDFVHHKQGNAIFI